MSKKSLRFYTVLVRWSPLKSYTGKIMLVAFVGTSLPLLVLMVYVLSTESLAYATVRRVLLTALAALALGLGATLYALHQLVAPIGMISQKLRAYLTSSIDPNLPTHFTDEVGQLMADTQQTIAKLDAMLMYTATYDPLTALPNRFLGRTHLEQAMAQAAAGGYALAVVVFDVDGFATLNTALGYATGDVIIKTIAGRLQGAVRQQDILARLDGDEFAIICANVTFVDELVSYVEGILAALAQPVALPSQEIYVSCSGGIALYPNDGSSAEQLLLNANTALLASRERGAGSFLFYASTMNEQLQQRLTLENDLRLALERQELQLYYQPQVNLRERTISGVEALIRWNHPTRGLISPKEFIPLAELTGLIVPIGEWVLRQACAQIQAWRAAGLQPVVVAVNLSGRQFKQPNLVALIRAILRDSQVDAAWLELEITESVMMDNIQDVSETLHQLRSLGLKIALDDFGTGYSSLNYLKTFPITTVKIDQSFVHDITAETRQASIAQAIITLAHSLNLEVLAEGVETLDQLQYLQAHGCDTIQGYFFSRPLPAPQLPQFLAGDVMIQVASS
ncbi:MAG TPA: bifunctional diguanylate cyclase/phosphodiesterase [Herpetosiphonaceae bacterium]|nr:bifunctional diguanylate cyclase/phosphodiesterase [Herpetosiphonaceae bacterium]